MFDVIELAELLEDPLADLLADLPARPSPPSSGVFEHSKTSEPALTINLSAAAAGVALESQAILDDKIKVFRTFCTAFDEIAKRFRTGCTFRFAERMSQSFLNHWASALNSDSQPQSQPQRVQSYASALVADIPTRRAAPPEFNDFQPAPTRGNAPDPLRRCPGPRQTRRPQEQQEGNSAVAYYDPRVFAQLHENSPAWDKQRFTIRTHLADKLDIKLGWAIRPTNLDIRNKIINEEACWAPTLGADAIELVPIKTLLISFLEEPKHPFCLFGMIRKAAKPNQCNLCWDYHSRHRLPQLPRPHPSNERTCAARPRRQDGAIKRLNRLEKKGIREISKRLFHQPHPEAAAAAAGPLSPALVALRGPDPTTYGRNAPTLTAPAQTPGP
ncbi:hypothetical protein G7Z17_g13198 [Cylindrodendrum hubeiense]|uniref:Uncharacterized protein n=1 Tax=Cylindrodendrum hubeiense TaxID=595255 RepID=A0A9P5GWV8_9HYPO|nr:hypothetical protein G7Z17_g13198 [Cylindrodendrum hubeiense]